PPLSTLFPYTTLFRSLLSASFCRKEAGFTTNPAFQRGFFHATSGCGADFGSEGALHGEGDALLLVRPTRPRPCGDPGFLHPRGKDRKSTRLNSSHVSI